MYNFKIWTGGIDGTSDTIQETGIIGSLRWWYEVVIRGLGGYACDPTADGRCPVKWKEEEYRCPVCELFGCTGWSRKFRMRVLDENNKLLTGSLNKEGITFTLELPKLKHITPEEKWLLIKTCDVICKYGSIGGRTIRKPQSKKGEVSKNYGLIHKIKFPDLPDISKSQVQQYLHAGAFEIVDNLKKNEPEWPDLKRFFFMENDFLYRVEMNDLMGLDDEGTPFSEEELSNSQFELFLRGAIGESKKIFSFHHDQNDQVNRLWGYVENDEMLDEVVQALSDMEFVDIKTGKEVLNNEF